MPIYTIFTCVVRFLHIVVASIVTLFSPVKSSKIKPSSGDIETGMLAHHSSDIEELELPIPSEVIDIRRQSNSTRTVESHSETNELPERRRSRRVSVHPVKSRIVDATLKNVRDRRFSVLKSVVITSCSMTPLPCSVKVEFLPESPALGLSPLNSALKALKSSKKRVVQFVLTPTFLPDIEISSRASHPGNSSIEDLFDLFPPPPLHLPIQPAISSRISVVNPSVDKRLSGVLCPAPNSLKDRHSSFTCPENPLSSTEASPSLVSVYAPITPGLVRTSSSIAFVIEQERSPEVYFGTEVSIRVDIPDSNVPNVSLASGPSMNNHLVSKTSLSALCCGEVPNDSEIVATHAAAASSCSIATPCVSSNHNPPVSTRSPSDGMDPKETEIDGITLDDKNNPSTRSIVQLKAVNTGSDGGVHHLSWRQSMEKILQAFRDTKTENQDFRDLFSSAFCRTISSISTMQRVDSFQDACVTSCSFHTSHVDMSCSSLSVEDTRDGDVAMPHSLSDDDILSTPVLGSILEPVVELAHSPAGSFGGAHESLLSGLGITPLELIHLDASKDTPSPRHLLRMLDRLVAIDGDTKAVNRLSSDSDLLPSFSTGN